MYLAWRNSNTEIGSVHFAAKMAAVKGLIEMK